MLTRNFITDIVLGVGGNNVENTALDIEFGEKMSIEVDNSLIMLRNRNNSMSFGIAITDKSGGMVNPITQSVDINPKNIWEITKVDRIKVIDLQSSVSVIIVGDNRVKHDIKIINNNVDDVGVSVFGRTPDYNKVNIITLRRMSYEKQ